MSTGMECNTILHIQKHGEPSWAYAYDTYCSLCGAHNTCNILKGTVAITKMGLHYNSTKKREDMT